MYLPHVYVRNFRCLRELRVGLQQGLNILVDGTTSGRPAYSLPFHMRLVPAPAGAGRSG